LDDLCRLAEGEKLEFLQIKSLSPTFVLELIESILTNSGELFATHRELVQVLRNRLMPLTVRYMSERHNFPQTVRIARILLILFKRHMILLTAECEMALGLLTHLLEPDGTAPWKRVLCMEVFRGLHAEPGLIRLIYSLYDGKEGRQNILRDHMASLVRLTSEKPSLIGVSHQSTAPSRVEHSRSPMEEQLTLEAGVAGVIGTAVTSADSNVSGISSQWSVVRTPYIELLDKTDPPPPPDTYIYTLVLNCISAFSEGLARFILPLTVPDIKKRKHHVSISDREVASASGSRELQRTDSFKSSSGSNSKKSPVPINPLDLETHPQIEEIKACAAIIATCWPAVLATCSTFLYAALDADFYHNLVRSFQKLTHVAGLLRQSTPRDAFLTTLGKAAMPADASSVKTSGTATMSGTDVQSASPADKTILGTESSGIGSPVAIDTSRTSFDIPASLSTRNLLCLRALLNLGIALGPTLDQPSWSIILMTLQHADLVIGVSAFMATKQNITANNNGDNAVASGTDVPKANIGAEIVAVQTAAARMFESTRDYPDNSFEDILTSLLNLSNSTEQNTQDATSAKISPSPQSPQPLRRIGRIHRNTRSISLAVGKSRVQDDELKFVLEKTSDLVRANVDRLSSPDVGAWHILVDSLISIIINRDISPNLRLKASGVLNDVIFQTMRLGTRENEPSQNQTQLRNLEALKSQITALDDSRSRTSGASYAADIDIHERALETLKSILEQYGELFVDGWDLVFDLISSVFEEPPPGEGEETVASQTKLKSRPLATKSPRLIRTAYDSLQLIASDFLTLLPPSCLLNLVDSFSSFGSQKQDFNISLTTTSFFWNVSDFLQGQIERFSIESHVDASASEDTLATLAKDTDVLVSRNSLWLLLLLRIVDLTTDSRSEIRNSAIRTLLRIFDAYGQQLSPKAWHLCLNRVLFAMVEAIEARVLDKTGTSTSANPDETRQWVETAVIMIKGCSGLMATFFDPILQDDQFDQSWERLLRYFRSFINVNLLEFSEAVFSSISDILSRVQTPDVLSKTSLRSAWSLWANGHPARLEGPPDLDNPNQDAMLAYLRSFQQIYRLFKDDLTEEHIEQVLQHMRTAIWNSVSSRYSVDTDHQSALQGLVVDCIKFICSDKESSQPAIILCLADFSDSALSKWSADQDKSRPTFVAFSKISTDLLSWYIAEFGIKRDIFTNGSLTSALEHLANPISQKYQWRGKDSEPTLWKKATTASLNILQVAIPYVEKQYEDSTQPEISRFWKCVVDIANGIVSARGYSELNLPIATILSDEAFDIAAFDRLKSLVIPALGSSVIPDKLRRDFACALFQSSLIHPPQRCDLPRHSIEDEPLKDLYKVRPGRTYDPPATPRSKIAFVLIDTLFELASASSSSGQQQQQETEKEKDSTSLRISLARSISPYLILRSAISLKSYIADQPLRGLMPQPTSARKELLHLLCRMVELRSEPAAIPDAPAFKADSDARLQHRKHLAWVYPLVVKAVQVAGKEREDGKVLEALRRILDEVGGCTYSD